jgi:hypothetical protein
MNNMMEKILKSGDLYVGFMDAVSEAVRATYDGSDSHGELNETYDKMTQLYLEFYQESLGKFLAVPQFGIPRESLHQIMTAFDSYYRFMGAIGDFLVKFNIPLKDSLEILQKTIKEREGTDGGFKSAKEIYDFAVDILDKRYDGYIKSPEGVQIVVDVVEKYLDYKKRSNAVRDIWFRSLSIPTSREMEDVYRGIYDLKKKTRKQEAILRDHEDLINRLNQKIRELEASLAGAATKKKKRV